jgi:hypothetical protein
MSKVRYSATFTLPDGSEYVLTRGSREDYGYAVAWLLLAGDNDRVSEGTIIAKGFSRDRRTAESRMRSALGDRRVVLFAPVTKGGVA